MQMKSQSESAGRNRANVAMNNLLSSHLAAHTMRSVGAPIDATITTTVPPVLPSVTLNAANGDNKYVQTGPEMSQLSSGAREIATATGA